MNAGTMAACRALLARDLLGASRRRSDAINVFLFFVIVASLFPFGLGPEPNLLRAVGPGVLWVAALLAGPNVTEADAQFRSALPAAITLNSTRLQSGGVLAVDLSPELLQVSGSDLGILIGSKAVTLESIQELTRVVAQRRRMPPLLWGALPLAVAGIIACLLDPLVDFFEQRLRIPRLRAILLVFFVGVATVVLMLGTLALLWRLDNSWFGRACRAIRDNPQAAAAMGVDVPRIKVIAFVVTSTLAGIAGIVALAWLFSEARRRVPWRTVAAGLALQALLPHWRRAGRGAASVVPSRT